jgi:hypothetical protein
LQSSTGPANNAELMKQLDRMHALMASGFASPEALSSYLAFLDAMPRDIRLTPKATVAVALIDNVLAMDELKLEQRQLRCTLDAAESATYTLLVRIGHRHAEMISRTCV